METESSAPFRYLTSGPWCIGIDRAPNHVHDLPHSRGGEHSPLRVEEIFLLQHLNEMGLEVRNLRQSGLARLQRNGRGTLLTVATEGHDQYRRRVVTEIPIVERYNHHPMALRSILQVSGPDFSPA